MIKFKRLTNTATILTRATRGSAGFDLYADEPALVGKTPTLIRTGIAWSAPEVVCGMVRPRSGLAVKAGIDTLAGTVDADYRGEIGVVLICHGREPYRIEPGDRIAQLVVVPVLTEWTEVAELDDTDRGAGGYGSTGR
jgi:dUTP pyrophosphatase